MGLLVCLFGLVGFFPFFLFHFCFVLIKFNRIYIQQRQELLVSSRFGVTDGTVGCSLQFEGYINHWLCSTVCIGKLQTAVKPLCCNINMA